MTTKNQKPQTVFTVLQQSNHFSPKQIENIEKVSHFKRSVQSVYYILQAYEGIKLYLSQIQELTRLSKASIVLARKILKEAGLIRQEKENHLAASAYYINK